MARRKHRRDRKAHLRRKQPRSISPGDLFTHHSRRDTLLRIALDRRPRVPFSRAEAAAKYRRYQPRHRRPRIIPHPLKPALPATVAKFPATLANFVDTAAANT